MMAPIFRFRKLVLEPVKCHAIFNNKRTDRDLASAATVASCHSNKIRSWSCLDCCFWMIGYMCTTWWILLLLFNSLTPSLPGFSLPESPGAKLRREGLKPLHPVVLVPGIVTGGLELWEGRPCADGLFRKRIWAGGFTQVIKRPLCWLEHMSLDNETGLDPPGIRVRAVSGLVAADYFALGYFVWGVLIENLAHIGYEGKNMHMAAYDWRLSFQNTEGYSSWNFHSLVPARKPKPLCGELWTEYDEMDQESIRAVAEKKVYTATTVFDLLRFVAPKMMQRADAHFSYGLADNLDDPKYSHYKYWSNPLETKFPDAANMEMYCLYGVGIPTERSYVYEVSPSDRCRSIPFRIDSSADGSDNGCLKNGVYFADGDESVPALSAGFMCAKGWRGGSQFNPSGMATYVREYKHKPSANLLQGRGLESGAHVGIMGNFALIEDVMRVAAGATGSEIGGDQIHSDILKMSQRISLHL